MPTTSPSDPKLRAQVLRQLTTMVEQYPNLRIGQIIGNAVGDPYYTSDVVLLRALQTLQAEYGQLQAAGISKDKL